LLPSLIPPPTPLDRAIRKQVGERGEVERDRPVGVALAQQAIRAAVDVEIERGAGDGVVEEEERREEGAAGAEDAVGFAQVVARGLEIEVREYRGREGEVERRVGVGEAELRRRDADAVVVRVEDVRVREAKIRMGGRDVPAAPA